MQRLFPQLRSCDDEVSLVAFTHTPRTRSSASQTAQYEGPSDISGDLYERQPREAANAVCAARLVRRTCAQGEHFNRQNLHQGLPAAMLSSPST